ncbi:MAG: hypothetical protein V4512_05765 [Pseudomonadota bacterium]
MAMYHNARIDMPPYAQKIEIVTFGGVTGFGTGFIVDAFDRRWIVTCWHNLEPGTEIITGQVNTKSLRFVNPEGPLIDLHSGRSVVGVRINGIHADCAAIEIQNDEAPDVPRFLSGASMSAENWPKPETIRIGGINGGPGLLVPVVANHIVQGFPGFDTNAPAITNRAVTVAGLPKPHPWMFAYFPAGARGLSGGPVVTINGETSQLSGIHTHTIGATDLKLDGVRSDNGADAAAVLNSESGAAVPIHPLLIKLRNASIGIEIFQTNISMSNGKLHIDL